MIKMMYDISLRRLPIFATTLDRYMRLKANFCLRCFKTFLGDCDNETDMAERGWKERGADNEI